MTAREETAIQGMIAARSADPILARRRLLSMTTSTSFPLTWLDELDVLAAAWAGGDNVTASAAEAALALWRARLQRPAVPEEEWLDVVTPSGEPYGWSAPRWFCHLVGLRHRVVYVYLTTPQGLLALQMRAHTKPEWPSRFDTTVAGHVKAGRTWEEGVMAEIEEELGLAAITRKRWLANGRLQPVAGYERYSVDEGLPPYRNRQVNRIFAGTLTAWGLAHVGFADGEVGGLYLCRPEEAQRLVTTGFLVAPGLQRSFPYWWAWWLAQSGQTVPAAP